MSALDVFSPETRAWFEGAFAEPTPAQELGWPAIARGGHTLIQAPTGSGKTLAAFLYGIDRLKDTPGKGLRLLYVSPLKALNYDVERNLRGPLAGLNSSLDVAVRTGDTPQKERAAMLRKPPDILITTPESLYLLLTSRARDNLRGVETLILDEVHAVAGTKRGAHLAISVERLERLVEKPLQRIGLSATQRPLEEIGRFVAGGREIELVDAGRSKELDLEIVVPVEDMREPGGGPVSQPDMVDNSALTTPTEGGTVEPLRSRRGCGGEAPAQTNGVLDHVAALRDALVDGPFDEASLESRLRGLADARGVKAGTLIHATRIAMTGRMVSPGPLRNARAPRPRARWRSPRGDDSASERAMTSRRQFIQTLGTAMALTSTRSRAQTMTDVDFIVIGAGSAGCVIANRLSATPGTRVLLLEAGGPWTGDPSIVTPGRWVSLLGTAVDWGYSTEAEPGLGGRAIAFPRGKIVGGSSAINAMAYIRGHRLDFDGWQRLGLDGWGYDQVLPLFKANEDNSRGASRYRGAGGPLRVSDCTDPHAGHAAFLDAARTNGYRTGSTSWDFFQPEHENGAGYYQKNIKDGQRHSAAQAFLIPIMSRRNLRVLTDAQATRLLIEQSRVTGVEFVREGRVERARAREVTAVFKPENEKFSESFSRCDSGNFTARGSPAGPACRSAARPDSPVAGSPRLVERLPHGIILRLPDAA